MTFGFAIEEADGERLHSRMLAGLTTLQFKMLSTGLFHDR